MERERAVVKQTWYCELCGLDATFVHYADEDSGLVKAGVLKQHRRESPECPAEDVGPIRFRDRQTEPVKRVIPIRM